MPAGKDARDEPSLKNPEMYEALRDDGASKEKAARISNAAARDGRRPRPTARSRRRRRPPRAGT